MTDHDQPTPEPALPRMTEVPENPPKLPYGLAVIALASGIISLLSAGATSLFGLGIGIGAIIVIERSKGTLKGRRYAVAGFVMSLISVVFLIMQYQRMVKIVFPFLERARVENNSSICLSNMMRVNMGVILQSIDSLGFPPEPASWTKAVSYIDKKTLICPSLKTDKTCYALNDKLSKITLGMIPNREKTIFIYESNPGNNPHGGIELLPSPGRHSGLNSMGFADGHVKALTVEEAKTMVWDPAKR